MAKLNFPDPSASPFNADNGVIYVWVDQGGGKGYWSGSAELTSENLDAVFVEVKGDNMTGNLSLGGASNLLLDASLGKIIGQSTADTDPAGTLVTKDYIDNNVLSDDFLSLKADAGDQIVLSPGDTSFTGNVGIGTSGFDNLGAVYSPSLGLKGTIGSRLGLWGNGGRWWYAQTETSNKFILGTRITGNAVDKSLITVGTDGHVGIGTDSPDTNLQIDDVTPELRLNSTDGTLRRMSFTGPGSSIWYLKSFGLDGTYNNSFEIAQGNDSRLFIQSGGNVGIGTSDPTRNLVVNKAGGNAFISVRSMDTGFAGLLLGDQTADNRGQISYSNNVDSMQFLTAGSEKMRIDSSGNVLQGTATARTGLKFGGTSITPLSQIEKLDGTASLSIVRNSNNTNGSTLYLGKSRGGSNGSATTVTQGDRIGSVSFNGADGSSLAQAARIDTEVDGTVSEGSVPGRLVFFTTSAGETGPQEKMRIRSNGNVGIGTSTPSKKLEVGENVSGTLGGVIKISNRVNVAPGTQAALELQPNNNDDRAASIVGEQDTESSTKVNLIFNTPNSTLPQERMRITHDGNVGIGTDTPQAKLDVNGTIKATSIQFPGSSSTLDDYEEGTFTPTVQDATVYANQKGYYTKVGKLVTFTLRVQPTAGTPSATILTIGGLPFPCESIDAGPYGGVYRTLGTLADDSVVDNLNWHIPINNSLIRAYTGSSTINTNATGVNLVGNFIFHGFYYTDD